MSTCASSTKGRSAEARSSLKRRKGVRNAVGNTPMVELPNLSPMPFIACALKVSQRMERGNIVCVLADAGWKYLSSELWTKEYDDLDMKVEGMVWWQQFVRPPAHPIWYTTAICSEWLGPHVYRTGNGHPG